MTHTTGKTHRIPPIESHGLFVSKERSVIDGAIYGVLNHQIKAIEFNAMAEKEIKIPLKTILAAALIAIDECNNSRPAGSENEEPQWITIDQLAEQLAANSQFTDVYSFLSQALSFVAYYGTPVEHQGLVVIAADPCGYDVRFNEIFRRTSRSTK